MKKITGAFLAVFLLLSQPSSADPAAWHPRYKDSHITFFSREMAQDYQGHFQRFTSEITFDPEDLQNSHVKTVIDMTSVTRHAADRDKSLHSSDWFDTDAYTTAVFEADRFEKTGDTGYIAHGRLTIKDISKPLALPFTLEINGDTAVMQSDFELLRLDYDVGINDWADTSFVANQVRLNIYLVADKKTP